MLSKPLPPLVVFWRRFTICNFLGRYKARSSDAQVRSKLNIGLQVNYFPSRFDPVRQSERFPENRMAISGARERRMLDKVSLPRAHLFPWTYQNFNDMLARSSWKVCKARKTMVEDDTERAIVGAGEQLQAARG